MTFFVAMPYGFCTLFHYFYSTMIHESNLGGTNHIVHVLMNLKQVKCVLQQPHSEESLLPNICGLPLLLFFWLKWAGYLAVAGLNLLAQISDRISPFGV